MSGSVVITREELERLIGDIRCKERNLTNKQTANRVNALVSEPVSYRRVERVVRKLRKLENESAQVNDENSKFVLNTLDSNVSQDNVLGQKTRGKDIKIDQEELKNIKDDPKDENFTPSKPPLSQVRKEEETSTKKDNDDDEDIDEDDDEDENENDTSFQESFNDKRKFHAPSPILNHAESIAKQAEILANEGGDHEILSEVNTDVKEFAERLAKESPMKKTAASVQEEKNKDLIDASVPKKADNLPPQPPKDKVKEKQEQEQEEEQEEEEEEEMKQEGEEVVQATQEQQTQIPHTVTPPELEDDNEGQQLKAKKSCFCM